MGIVAKKCSFPIKYRIIHDLSWPPQDSVINHTDPDAFRCFYGSFDNMVALIIKHGVGTMSTNWTLFIPSITSLLEAKIVPSWAHLGTSSSQIDIWSASTTWTSFFPLGCAVSPALFNEYADALQYTMQINKVQNLLHYRDDYFIVGPLDSPVCASNIVTMIAMCEELGFAVNPKKVTKPTTTTNFIGVDIDTVTMDARIDSSHLSETISLLKDILGHWSATKQTILLLVGKLHFVCWVCRPDRAFLHCMIETSMKAQHLYHRINWVRSFIGMSNGGCNVCLPGMGLDFYTGCIGSPVQSSNLSQIPVM